jgi:CO dehydrogenase/acetyl-CoA synthase beta subunit
MVQEEISGIPSHGHGAGIVLEPEAAAILQRGIAQLIEMTAGLAFRDLPSERFPLPLSAAIYGRVPDRSEVLEDIRRIPDTDPVGRLDYVLVLLELYCSNATAAMETVPDDQAFLDLTFSTKRQNGWIAFLGDADASDLKERIAARWRFHCVDGSDGLVAPYVLLNMLARYAFVYGRIEPGDGHGMGHFIEDFAPGVFACSGRLSDPELTVLLAAMKIGVPAVVGTEFPFELGRRIAAETDTQIVESLTMFPNTHKLTDHPELPRLPDYLDSDSVKEEFEPAVTWGNQEGSYYLFRKDRVDIADRVEIVGAPDGALGVVVTSDAEPLDAHDRQYIERTSVNRLNMIRGVRGRLVDGRLEVSFAVDSTCTPEQIGRTLLASIRHDFPLIERVSVRLCFDRGALAEEVASVNAERDQRQREIRSATEETANVFFSCVGCSPFAPDHVCILTPERLPQCGRGYAQIGAIARYGYDEMSSIHHRAIHAGHNSYGVVEKGETIDQTKGEWSGVNDAVSRLSGGRTTRIQLHSLDDVPHTGCSCFRMIMFKTEVPRPGIGIMDRRFERTAPDGRSWRDLHYGLTGKQTSGMAGATPAYLKSPKFLCAHGGWDAVVWVSPAIAEYMGGHLPVSVSKSAEP